MQTDAGVIVTAMLFTPVLQRQMQLRILFCNVSGISISFVFIAFMFEDTRESMWVRVARKPGKMEYMKIRGRGYAVSH